MYGMASAQKAALRATLARVLHNNNNRPLDFFYGLKDSLLVKTASSDPTCVACVRSRRQKRTATQRV